MVIKKNKNTHTLLIRPMTQLVFANDPGDWGSIPGRAVLKTQKWYLMPPCLTHQRYKVRINGKVEQSREWSSALPYTSV